MEEKNRIRDEITLTLSLKMLATAYEEIAVTKIRLARDNVLHLREFLASLAEVFYNVKSSYKNQLKSMAKEGNTKIIQQFRTHQTNGKKVLVFLSMNNKLYGDIVLRVFRTFLEYAIDPDVDLVIIGKVGKELYDATDRPRMYTYFEIPDTKADLESLKEIIHFMFQYETVTIFYGKFVNIVNQVAELSDITGEASFQTTLKEENVKEYGFIIEPSLEKVLDFFDSQIFTTFFKQTVHEGELARYASRVTAMEQALESIGTKLKFLDATEKRIKHLQDNKKQMERLASISARIQRHL